VRHRADGVHRQPIKRGATGIPHTSLHRSRHLVEADLVVVDVATHQAVVTEITPSAICKITGLAHVFWLLGFDRDLEPPPEIKRIFADRVPK
jgi:hypothetical protein